MAEYRTGAHTIYDIQYHLRGEVAERARELIGQSCMSRDMSRDTKILKGQVSKEHVHLLVSCPPSLSPAKVMQYLKGRSSRLLQEEFPHLKKRYWGQHLWARSGPLGPRLSAVT